MSNSEDTTTVFTDINKALRASDQESKEKNACLIAMGGELNGTLFELPTGIVSLGRSANHTYALEFQGISRNHLQLEVGEKVILTDLDSRNGSFLNNKRIDGPTELQQGDVIKLGIVALKFIPKGDAERLTYDKLNRVANTDGLTKCYNKMYFNQGLRFGH